VAPGNLFKRAMGLRKEPFEKIQAGKKKKKKKKAHLCAKKGLP